jgi:hypothetical protein
MVLVRLLKANGIPANSKIKRIFSAINAGKKNVKTEIRRWDVQFGTGSGLILKNC